jgi:hypothetical protein
MFKEQLRKVCEGIKEAEGWFIDSRSWRNHNPGNLRWSPFALGSDGEFAKFIDDQTGFFAMMWDVHQKAKGETRTGLNGEKTIEDLIKVWTAAELTDLEKYIKIVERVSGLNRKTKLKELI